ncbi:MAG: hypothetical protein R3212_10595 [Xanthomonadales bacterium]|nr:hypothetical protein [Xanthomonadales bacterium]
MKTRLNWLFWETLIIVVGVLIALSVDDYWSDRQDRTLELDYLQRLRIEVQEDLDHANRYIEQNLGRKLAALDTVAPVVRGEAPVPEDLEPFLFDVGMAALGAVAPSRWVSDTTFDDLRATGNLRLIRNTEVRRMLSDYYRAADDFVNRLRARTTAYPRLVHSILPAELRDNYNMAAAEAFGIERAIERIQSQETLDLIHQEYNFAWFAQRSYGIQRDLAQRLLEALDQYIAELEEG